MEQRSFTRKKVFSGMVWFLSVAYSLSTVNTIKNFHSSSWQVGSVAPAVAILKCLKWHCPCVELFLRPAGALVWEESFFWTCKGCFPLGNCYPFGSISQSKADFRTFAIPRVSTSAWPELFSKSSHLDNAKLKLSVSGCLLDLKNKIPSVFRYLLSSRSA